MIDMNIKVAAFDFDDTIYIHPTHNYSREDDINLFARIIAGDKNVYPKERFNPTILEFMKYCHESGITIALCSRCSVAEEAFYKIQTIRELLDIPITNLCVGENAMKPVALEACARMCRLKRSEILFVDDLWDNLEAVEKAGFKAASPSEVELYMRNVAEKERAVGDAAVPVFKPLP